jgi:outer membrane biosynthesis protein TonB
MKRSMMRPTLGALICVAIGSGGQLYGQAPKKAEPVTRVRLDAEGGTADVDAELRKLGASKRPAGEESAGSRSTAQTTIGNMTVQADRMLGLWVDPDSEAEGNVVVTLWQTGGEYVKLNADRMSLNRPEYSDSAREEGRSGVVVLDVAIHPNGTFEVLDVVEDIGGGLTASAIEAVGQWKLEPGSGAEEDVRVNLELPFRLP